MEEQKELKKDQIRLVRDQLQRILSIVRRSFRHVGKASLLFFLGCLVALGLALAKKRLYFSEAVILYRRLISANYLGGNDAQTNSAENISMRLQETLLARPYLKQIIDEFKLYPEIVDKRGYVQAVDNLRKMIGFNMEGGDTFHVSFTGPSPELAQKVTAKLARSLIEKEEKGRRLSADRTVGFLREEQLRVTNALKEREKALAEFLALYPEFAQEDVAGLGPQGRTAGAAVRARAQLQRKIDPTFLALQRQSRRIKDAIKHGTTGTAMRDPMLLERLHEAEQDLANSREALRNAKEQFTELHPTVQATKRREEMTRQRVENLKKAVAASTHFQGGNKVNKEELNVRAGQIDDQIDQYRSRKSKALRSSSAANEIVTLETNWTQLNREVQEAREQYLRMEERVFRATLEASANVGGQIAQLEIIDPAYLPTRPATMGRTMMTMAGVALSAFLAMVLMLGLAVLDDRVYDRLDIERLGIAEILAEVPKTERPWNLKMFLEKLPKWRNRSG
ncbi:MAG: hypothetical protein V1754_13705 [Pseudomonadota bacterium]